MTKVYPDGVPEIKLSIAFNSNNLINVSKEQLNELEMKLIKEARSLVGNEMCFDLIESAREYCDRLVKKGKVSFHTEMLKTKEEKDKEAMDIQANQLQKDEEIMLKQRKAELEELEKRIRDELKEKLVLNNQTIDDIYNEKQRSISPLNFNQQIGTDFAFDPAIAIDDGIEVKSVSVLMNQSNHYNKFKVKTDEGKVFDLKIIPLSHPFLQTFGGRRQLEVLLKQLKNHPIKGHENVLRCFGGSIDKLNNRLFLLYEEDETTNCVANFTYILEQSGGLSLQRTIEYLKQICSGLIHLHSAGITHRSLDLNSLNLFSGRKLKIEDYLVRKCLLDLSREHGIQFDGYEVCELKQTWEAPEIITRPNLQGKKVDIWSIGRLAIQMLFGPEVMNSYNSFNEFIKSGQVKKLPENLREFLDICFKYDSAKRLTAEELINCEIFRDTIEIEPTLIEHVKVNKGSLGHVISNNPTNNTAGLTSRYLMDFEELEFLGRGGFGSVVKVRNKIDDRFYAVKKIALDPRDIEYNKKILREVTTLSRLHHERIIRYYQAWIEDALDNDRDEDDDTEGSTEDYSTSTTGAYTTSANINRKQSKIIDLSLGPKSFKPFRGLIDDDLEFDYIEEEDEDSEISDFIQFEGSSELTGFAIESESESETESESQSTKQQNTATATGSSSKSTHDQVLYIQMEYCPNQTLRDLIDERNSDPSGHFLDPPEIWRLFRQIVEGLVHIHAQGMMHRDLKPSNIFLDSNGDVKIGDFGLAVTRIESTITGRSESPMNGLIPANSTSRAGNDKSITGESHTQNIGTPFYVSPEQIVSSSTARYNQKVDMYSLGIILIELWAPFQTGMERVQSLQKCRSPEMIFPGGLEENVMKIGKKLLCHDTKKRFTSLELLRSDLLPPMLEEELMEDAVRSVVQPQAAHFPRLISTIFKRVSELDSSQLKAKDFAFDVHSGNATELGVCEEAAKMKKELIERVFLKHGGIEINPPLLYLPLGPSEAQAYSVLDDSGQRLELPSNLTRPFARWVAQSSLQTKTLKRYSVDQVFRKISQVTGGQPYQPNEAAFDIIDSEDESSLLGLSEVVRVAFDSIKILSPNLKNDHLIFSFNHLKLRKRFSSSDEKLLKLLNPVKFDEPCEALIQRLKANLPDLRQLFDDLTALLKYLQKLSIPSKVKIVFDPLLSGPRPELYENDFLFVISRETGKRGVIETLSCGGRYNQLVRLSDYIREFTNLYTCTFVVLCMFIAFYLKIEEYKFPTARLEGKGPFGVGVSLFLDNFPVSAISKRAKNSGMVLSLLEEPSAEEMWLIGEIWRLGRGAQLTVQSKHGSLNAISIGSNCMQIQVKSNSGKVRVKIGRDVEEVPLEDFPSKLENNEFNIFDQAGLGSLMSDSQDPGNLETDADDPGTVSFNESNIPVHYILSTPKSERSNPILREKAIKALKQFTATATKSPEVLIHELPRDMITKIIYDPLALKSLKMSEEQRDQMNRMCQFINSSGVGKKPANGATSSTGKVTVLFNHKDNQTDIIYMK